MKDYKTEVKGTVNNYICVCSRNVGLLFLNHFGGLVGRMLTLYVKADQSATLIT